MAAGMLGAMLPRSDIQSAGLGALVGMPADDTAMRLMTERGIDISAHRAVQITRQMCLRADLVLVMETAQRHRLEQMYPEARGRVFRVCEATKLDVPDPFTKPRRMFEAALTLIETGVDNWCRRLQKIS